MSPSSRIVVDTSLLVGLVDRGDKWHQPGIALREALKTAQAEMVYFDCVVNEAVSVLARRARERKRSEEFVDLLTHLTSIVPQESITWISAKTEQLYPEIMALVQKTGGDLNFHDGLIALGSRESSIRWIASFDSDFDRVSWIKRLTDPDDVAHVSSIL
jgi:predicted nucleic acid-binding protein